MRGVKFSRSSAPAAPGPPGPPPPDAAKKPAYFSDQRKGEVNELKNLLRNINVEKDQKRKRDIVKKVIAYMTLGIDVSRLFSEMVMCVDTKDMVLKKMVYQYLTNYAATNSELAILCINTLLTDCRNEDPMVRGLALRSLCSLRLESILEYIHDPLQASLTDSSAYVRKTGVLGILKVFSLNSELVKDTEMVDTLYNMLRDRDTHVVANCIVALNEIMADEGGMAVNTQIITHLLNRIGEFNEWGQCDVLNLVARYKPATHEETFNIMNILESCLRVSSSAVVLGATKCFLHLTEDMPDFHMQVYNRLKQPLLTLMAGGSSELNYVVLHHIEQMVNRQPGVFDDEYRQFYTRYHEPSHVKFVKIEILASVANEKNMHDIVQELSEYVTGIDQELSRRSVRAIALIAVKIESVSEQIVDQLLEFLEMDVDYVRAETMKVMKDLLRKYPEDRHVVLPVVSRVLKRIDDPEGKAAVIWMMGEFGEDVRAAPYILEPLIDNFVDETSSIIASELLTATMKLFFKRPPEVQAMLGRLLQSAVNDSADTEIHDRALLYFRLLQTNVQAAAAVVNYVKPPIEMFSEERDNDIRDKLFSEFNSLAIIYGKPSETFIAEDHQIKEMMAEEAAELAEQNGPGYDNDEGYDEEDDPEHHHAAPGHGAQTTNLLDFDLLGGQPQASPPPSPGFDLVPNTQLDAGTFQGKWAQLQASANVEVQASRVMATGELEQLLAQRSIYTIASGDMGTHLKFFFYAQDTSGSFHLVESFLEKATVYFTATVKSDNPAGGPHFASHLKTIISSL